MDGNERQRLMKRAAQLKQASQPASKAKNRPSFDEEDDQSVVHKKRSASLNDYVWKLLTEEATPVAVALPKLTGTVVSIGSGVCEVVLKGVLTGCVLTPDLAKRQLTELAVGDEAALEQRGDHCFVVGVLPRRTKLSRPDAGNANLERVVVANVDAVVVVVSVVSPPLHPRVIDRYLIAIQRGGAIPVIAVNKLDLHTSETALAEDLERLRPYEALGVPVVLCSAGDGRGRTELLEVLKGHLSAFVGHSGVGKSSLLNMMRPELALKTGAVSERYGRGTHTTTRSTLWDLGDGTRMIDTPGIRSFGLWKLAEEELLWYFPEFAKVRCKFGDCSHIHEPSCGVKEGVQNGAISEDRYKTYLRLKASMQGE